MLNTSYEPNTIVSATLNDSVNKPETIQPKRISKANKRSLELKGDKQQMKRNTKPSSILNHNIYKRLKQTSQTPTNKFFKPKKTKHQKATSSSIFQIRGKGKTQLYVIERKNNNTLLRDTLSDVKIDGSVETGEGGHEVMLPRMINKSEIKNL